MADENDNEQLSANDISHEGSFPTISRSVAGGIRVPGRLTQTGVPSSGPLQDDQRPMGTHESGRLGPVTFFTGQSRVPVDTGPNPEGQVPRDATATTEATQGLTPGGHAPNNITDEQRKAVTHAHYLDRMDPNKAEAYQNAATQAIAQAVGKDPKSFTAQERWLAGLGEAQKHEQDGGWSYQQLGGFLADHAWSVARNAADQGHWYNAAAFLNAGHGHIVDGKDVTFSPMETRMLVHVRDLQDKPDNQENKYKTYALSYEDFGKWIHEKGNGYHAMMGNPNWLDHSLGAYEQGKGNRAAPSPEKPGYYEDVPRGYETDKYGHTHAFGSARDWHGPTYEKPYGGENPMLAAHQAQAQAKTPVYDYAGNEVSPSQMNNTNRTYYDKNGNPLRMSFSVLGNEPLGRATSARDISAEHRNENTVQGRHEDVENREQHHDTRSDNAITAHDERAAADRESREGIAARSETGKQGRFTQGQQSTQQRFETGEDRKDQRANANITATPIAPRPQPAPQAPPPQAMQPEPQQAPQPQTPRNSQSRFDEAVAPNPLVPTMFSAARDNGRMQPQMEEQPQQRPQQHPIIHSAAEYAKLPQGTTYVGPDGVPRTKQ